MSRRGLKSPLFPRRKNHAGVGHSEPRASADSSEPQMTAQLTSSWRSWNTRKTAVPDGRLSRSPTAALKSLLIIYVAFVTTLFLYSPIVAHGDSDDFENMTSHAWSSPQLWGGKKPPTTAVFFKMFNKHGPNQSLAVTSFYFILSTTGWITLVVTAHQALTHPWLKIAAPAILLLFASSNEIFIWHRQKLSESPALSLFVLLVALILVIIVHHHRLRTQPIHTIAPLAAALALLLFLWTFSRDTNIYVLLPAGLLAAAIILRRWRRVHRPGLWFSLALLVIPLAVGQSISADYQQRWRYPLVNVIGQRILPDQDKRAFFIAHGMPDTAAVRQFRGRWAASSDWSEFGTWLPTHGKDTYFKLLLAKLPFTLSAPLQDWDMWLNPNVRDYQRSHSGPASLFALHRILSRLGWPTGYAPLVLLTAAAAATGLVLFRHIPISAHLTFSLALLGVATPGILGCWHGDAAEIARHCLGAAAHLRLATWLVLIFSADALVRQMPYQNRPTPPSRSAAATQNLPLPV